jgi:hypothetical protein
MPIPPVVNVTDEQTERSDVAATELRAMLLGGVASPGGLNNITAPFKGLESIPDAAVDLYETIQLSTLRLFSGFSAFDNVTASYPHTSAPFDSRGGTLLISVSASAFATVDGMLGIDIKIDGNPVGVIEMYGETGIHEMLSRMVLVPNIATGSHTLSMTLRANTSADTDDRVSAIVIEMPF